MYRGFQDTFRLLHHNNNWTWLSNWGPTDPVGPLPSHLRITVEAYPPYTFIEGEGKDVKVWGPMKKVIDDITTGMGATYEFIRPHDHAFGAKNTDGQWSGMIGLVVKNEADVILGPLGVTEIRKTAIDFSLPFIVDYLGILQARPPREINPGFFLHAVDWRAWIFMLVCCFVTSATFSYIQRRNYTPDVNDPERVNSFFKNIFGLLSAIVLQGDSGIMVKRIATRILLGMWTICTYIVGVAFGQQMIAMLAVPIVRPIETARQLLTLEEYGIVMEKQTAFTQAFSDARYGIFKELWQMKLKKGLELPAAQLENIVVDGTLREQTYVMIAETAMIKTFMSASVLPEDRGACGFYMAKEEFFPLNFAMGFSKNLSSAIAPFINNGLFSLVESGIWIQLLKQSTPHLAPCLVHPSKEKFDSTGMNNVYALQGVFYTLLCGLGVSLISLIAESACFKYLRKSDSKEDGRIFLVPKT